jgi:peptidoglycan-associated lipoprotein
MARAVKLERLSRRRSSRGCTSAKETAMQRNRIVTAALHAVGLAGALAAGASVANAQAREDEHQPSADRTAPKPPEATVPEKTTEARPGPLDVVVQFELNSTNLEASASGALDRTAEWLKQDPTHTITIEVHPDEAASGKVDASVVESRAGATKAYLVAQGVAESQIEISMNGSDMAAPPDRAHRTVFVATLDARAAVTGTADDIDAGGSVAVAPLPAEAPVTYVDDDDDGDDHLMTRFGMALTVGGGVVDFLDDDARALGDMGGAWEARLTLGTRSPLAIEAAYVGSAHNIDALGLDGNAVLLGTAVETDLRVNFTTGPVQPYVFGGLGYTRYDVTNEDFNTSSVNDEEQMGHIPVGAGIGTQWGGFLLDLRGTVRPAFEDDLVDEPALEDDPLDETDTATDLDTWSVAARMGWEF